MVGLAGCSGDVQFGDKLGGNNPGGTSTAPPANINIVLSSATLLSSASDAANGVTITAIVTDAANNTVEGATVAFAATSGALQVTQAVTDTSGVAKAILTTGGDSSIRQIIVGAASGSVSRTAAVQVVSSTASGPPVDSLALLPATGSLTPSGSLDLQAFVANSASPNGLAGVPVTWATSAGLLTGLTLPDHTSVSDSTGNAHATLTTGGDPTLTSITVTATAGGHSQSRTYTVAGGGVGVSALNLVASGTQLAADADQVAEGITIRAIATDSHGNVVAGVPVSFAIPPPSSGALIVTQGTTDANGQAVAILTTGGNPAARTINVTATVGTLTRTLSPAIQVVGSIGPVPAALNVFASSASLPATASAPANGVTISAVVTDANGVTVPGVPVTFSAPTAAISVTQGITDANGIATALLTTGGNSSPRTINVTAATGSISRTIGIAVIGAGAGPTVNAISLTGSSTTLPASATTSASAGAITLTAFVRDTNNNAVQGATIAFSSTAGQLSQVQATSDANGQATAVLSTGGDTALPPTITVTASASGHTANLAITVVNGTSVNATSINVVAASPTLSSSANTPALGDQITATVLDSNLNPVPGVTAQFTTSAGALANINATTDANGQASAVLTTGGASTLPPTITVTAKVGSITGTTTVSVVTPVSNITLLASAPQLPSAASTVQQGITLTALVTDGNGNFVAGVPVTFSAPGAGIQVTQGTTDASGSATAILTTGGNPANRQLTVTASASGASDALPIAVTGTTLQINGPTVVGSGDTVTYQVQLRDSSLTGIAGRTVTVHSASGNTLSAGTVTTGFGGSATFTLTGTVPNADTLTVSSTGAVGTLHLTVVADKLTFVAQCNDNDDNDSDGFVDLADPQCVDATDNNESSFSGSDPAIAINGPANPITVLFTHNGTPTAGRTVNFVTTRGDFDGVLGAPLVKTTTATDIGGGFYRVALLSDGSDGAGGSLVTATEQQSGASASESVVFISTSPSQIDLQASPSTIPVSGSSTLTAVVRDANNNLVADQLVNFTLSDPTGGNLSSSSGITNSQGAISVTYNASTTPSATNGVQVTATVNGTGITDVATLTVGGQALFIALGTGNDITEPTATTYALPYAAIVTDSAGNAAPSSTVFRVSVVSVAYQKGTMQCDLVSKNWVPAYQVVADGDPGEEDSTSPGGAFGCLSEDANQNGILDPSEDFNTNNKLDPGDVVVVPSNITLTDGVAQFTLTYTQDRSFWVKVTLKAVASVAGTESVETATFVLPGKASDFANCPTTSPPGPVSPYGTAASCSNPN